MPIYTTIDNWEQVKDLKQGEIFQFRKIINDAMSKNKDVSFMFKEGLTPNKDYREPYIYSYDINDTLMDRGEFVNNLERLIQYANQILAGSSMKYYQNYKFDIMGNWTEGRIILIKKKDYNANMKDRRKSVKKFYKDTYKQTKKTIKNMLFS